MLAAARGRPTKPHQLPSLQDSVCGFAGVGAVGVLQFDVVVARLKSEYNVEAIYEGVNVATARWVECDDEKKLDEFRRKCATNLALDGGDSLAYIAPTRVNLNLSMERYPDVRFLETREHSLGTKENECISISSRQI